MDTALTGEQDAIRRTVRELLHKHCTPDAVRTAVLTGPGYDEDLWQRLGGTLGLPGLALPEEYAGTGCTLVEQALAHEETGRALLPSPLLAGGALCAPLLLALGTPAQRAAHLPRLATGALTASLVLPEGTLPLALGLTGEPGTPAADWAGGGRAGGIQAGPDGAGGWRLYGEAGQALAAHSAGLLLVAAHAGGYARSRTLLFLVEAGAEGLVRARQTALDETRAVGRVELRDTPATLLGEDEDADVTAALARTGAGAAALIAAEAVGAADSALERTVEYVTLREQFGRPIGSFQAVQHRLADVYVQVQSARSAAYYAAWEAACGPEGGHGVSGGVALAQALEALRLAAGEAVQLHGGVGFTWEHEAHLYFKRAAGDELLFGPVHRLREHAALRAGLFGAQGETAQVNGTGSRGEVTV
ncbi:acyl-CoA dehydrogenase family protein [Streptomyces sp. HNM0574]|uniref:acyl-CoA dehydrogenase family protein n=1 Tax=Streptomyces sp. HNM0574 TaxID=2714954 RepID=UPI001469FB28|nr:acyl-CoA dehydrogenase family protein [Streptomyces sp. HNM0574]NLU70895.1 acyl-CoA/acyl-ACP dehydrogenase [Streptomyces sp. HNM0574]